MKKFTAGLVVLSALVLGYGVAARVASAHVVVTPAQAGVASWTTFKVSVPSEKPIATYKLRLDLPEGLKHITPNVKPGWVISTTKTGAGDSMRITDITWIGGPIPTERRDEFYFSAQVPAEVATLKWKAYQTYVDGSVVAWDAEPQPVSTTPGEKPAEDFSKSGPYSVTEVVNDLAPAPPQQPNNLSWLAFVLSVAALVTASMSLRRTRIIPRPDIH